MDVSAVGLDTRPTDDHHESLRLWLRLLTCTHLIETHVRKGLAAQFKTTLPRFDLMSQLERAPEGLQMGELSRRMLVTGGNVTGIVDQLERSGLIIRTEDPADRRAYLVKLTKEGRRLFAQMAAEHASWIVKLFSGIPKREQRALQESLSRLRSQLTRMPP
ncbi:MAG: MarR family transcriptional regulator [Pseudomonadota bacterium]|nr:MarR family transcriptional regulator [Pseudomonadota bacterium]